LHGAGAKGALRHDRYNNTDLPIGMTAALAERLEALFYDYREERIDPPIWPLDLAILVFEECRESLTEEPRR
jgi:hypothetical protein